MSKKQNAEEDYITTHISVLSYIEALERQLEEAREEIEQRQETEDSLTNEINFLCDLTENIALSLESNKKTKNNTKCVQQIIKLMMNFEEQLKEKGDEH